MRQERRDRMKEHYERRHRDDIARRSSLAQRKAREDEAVRAALAKRAQRPAPQAGDPAYIDVVFRMAPRLMAEPYAAAVKRLLKLPAARGLAGWSPRGCSRNAQFRSLCEHLLARYLVPALLWDGFFDADAEKLTPLIAHVAGGGSLFKYVTDTFPVPLTRRMCHELLAMPSRGSLFHAIRRVQVRAAGGDERLFQTWMTTPPGRALGSRADESFWTSVIAWLSKAEGLAPFVVAPLVDYIAHRRALDPGFSMTGRSVAATARARDEWHRGLTAQRVFHDVSLQPSGYAPVAIERVTRGRDGARERRVWRVHEVRSTAELAAEGRRMGHCVFSYAASIESGQTSIWSMTLEDGKGETGRWAMLTIEVRRDLRRVVQARGRFNRSATSEERAILLAWASKNGLEVSLGSWG